MIDYSKKQFADNSDINHWHTTFLSHFKVDGKRLLDIGCGPGAFLSKVKGLGGEVLGIEPNSYNFALAKEKQHPVLHGYANDFVEDIVNFRPDYVTLFEVIEHIVDVDTILDTVKECLLRIGKECTLVVSTPNAFNLFRAYDFIVFQRHRDPHMDPLLFDKAEHIRAYSYGMVVELLNRYGFEVKILSNLYLPQFLRCYLSRGIVVAATLGKNL